MPSAELRDDTHGSGTEIGEVQIIFRGRGVCTYVDIVEVCEANHVHAAGGEGEAGSGRRERGKTRSAQADGKTTTALAINLSGEVFFLK